ncbi:hypothetical protein EDB85DRAFT_1915648, partial [Lactarius pseudohatsudake]
QISSQCASSLSITLLLTLLLCESLPCVDSHNVVSSCMRILLRIPCGEPREREGWKVHVLLVERVLVIDANSLNM